MANAPATSQAQGDDTRIIKTRTLIGLAGAFAADLFATAPLGLASAIGLALASAVVDGVAITLIIPFVDLIAHGAPVSDWVTAAANRAFAVIGLHSSMQKLSGLLVAFAVLIVGRAALASLSDMQTLRLDLDFRISTQMAVVRALADSSWERVVRMRHAKITHLLGSDVYRVSIAVSAFLAFIIAALGFLARFALALAVQPIVTLLCLVVVAIGFAIFAPVLQGARRLGDVTIDTNLSLFDNTGQFLGGLKLAMSQELQQAFVSDFARLLGATRTQELTFVRQRNLNRITVTIIGAVAGVGVLLFGFDILHVSPSIMIALAFLLSRLGGPVSQMQLGSIEFVRNLPAHNHIKTLAQEMAIPQRPSAVHAPTAGDIEFAGVSYEHLGQEGSTIAAGGVMDVSLWIRRLEMLGISGPSGAGKTTLADLLVGLYAPQTGVIRVDGETVDLVSSPEWRRRLAYVSQDSFLSNESIRANLLWATPGATEAGIAEALSIVEGDLLLERLPLGIETILGERGSLVSGGERQRIALARALLRNPDLLVLDEATNALDIDSERRVLERLRRSRPHMAIVLIAHRTEALSHCDRVVVLQQGRIVHNGPFSDVRDGATTDRGWSERREIGT
jgi:ATP-binding cassette subfamily C protein